MSTAPGKPEGDPRATGVPRRLHQLEMGGLWGARAPGAPVTSRGVLKRLARWAPVWVPLVLLAQVGILGLRPALDERARLASEEQRLRARRAAAERSVHELSLLDRAHADPIYLAREQRWLQREALARLAPTPLLVAEPPQR